MPYLRNTTTTDVLGPMTDDGAEYQYLRLLKDEDGQPLYEEVPYRDAGVSDAAQVVSVQALVDALGATADFSAVIAKAPEDSKVTAVAYIPSAGVTGADTDTRSLEVVNVGLAGDGTTSVASLDLVSDTDLTGNAANDLTLSATGSHLVVAEGDELQFSSTHAGTSGLADPGGLVVISFSRD